MTARRFHRFAPVFVAAAFGVTLFSGRDAEAQTSPATGPRVSGDAKGAIGGGLLGAEVVDITLGIIGIHSAWPYIVFGIAGAAGGAVGGYFVEQEAPPEAPLYMLAGGMALVIPALVVTLNATLYQPPEATTEPVRNEPSTTPPAVQPVAPNPGAPGTPPPIQTRRIRSFEPRVAQRWASPGLPPLHRHIPMSLVDLYGGVASVAVPAVDVRPLYSPREMWMYGVPQGAEVQVPVFRATF